MADYDIKHYENKMYSGGGEDGVLISIFERINCVNKICVDIGAGDGRYSSNSRMLREIMGWRTWLFDRTGNDIVHREHITAENVASVLQAYNVPDVFDLLSLDIDGIDYWVLQSLLKSFTPLVIVAEYNGTLGNEKSITVPNIPGFMWEGLPSQYFGVSFQALLRLCLRHDYFLLGCESVGANAFFVKNEYAPLFGTLKPANEMFVPLGRCVYSRMLMNDKTTKEFVEVEV